MGRNHAKGFEDSNGDFPMSIDGLGCSMKRGGG